MAMTSGMMLKPAVKALLLWFFLVVVVMANVVESASGHTAPAPAADCTSLVLNMADCLSFVTSGSTAQQPEGSCCSGLKTVLKTDADCLCEAFKNSAQLGVTLNVSKALSLPAACRVSAPSVSKCALTAAGDAPALSPAAALSPSAAAASPTTVSGSSEVAPASAPGSSGSSALSHTFGPIVMAVIVASLALF